MTCAPKIIDVAFLWAIVWKPTLTFADSVIFSHGIPAFEHIPRIRRESGFAHNWVRRNSCALTATMTVLADIRTAANAGGRRTPCAARMPAAKGMATML